MPRITRLTALAASALLLTGCASGTMPQSAPDAASAATPAPSHTMPDGTVMEGSEHGEHMSGHSTTPTEHEQSADGPSHAAEMICGGQVLTAVAAKFGVENPQPTSDWAAPNFTCTFDIEGAPLVLTVHDATVMAEGEAYFADLQEQTEGAETIEGLLGLGLPSFSTGEGVVAFLRDGKTLTVDATALADSVAGGTMTRDEAAYSIASAVLTCWVEHD